MASSGPRYPAAATSVAGAGDDWSTPTNVGADDAATSDVTVSTGAGLVSEAIHATQYGFAIPAGATIDGVIVEIDASRSNATGNARDHTIQLLVGGTPTGTNKASGAAWNTVLTYGSSSDTWSAGLTAAIVNATDFGVSVKVQRTTGKGSTLCSADYIRVTVHYTESTTGDGPIFKGRAIGLGRIFGGSALSC